MFSGRDLQAATWINAGDDTPSLASLKPVYLALHIVGGHIGLPLLVLTFLLSKRASCHPTLMNFCIIWILYSVFYCLTAYDKNGLTNPSSPSKLCLAQAILINGASPMAAVAGVAVTVQLWSMFNEPHFYVSGWRNASRRADLALALAPPYLTFLVFAMASGLIIAAHPEMVGAPSGLYCSVQIDPLQDIVAVFCALMVAVITGFGVAIAIKFSRRWVKTQQAFPLAKRRPSISMSLRVAILIFYTWVTLGVCIVLVVHSKWALPYMIMASLPLVAFLIFGTQKDVFHVWCFWRWWRHKDSDGRECPQADSRRPSEAELMLEEALRTPILAVPETKKL